MVQRLETTDSPSFQVDTRYEPHQHKLNVKFNKTHNLLGFLSDFPETGDKVKVGSHNVWLEVVEVDVDSENIREYVVKAFEVDSDEFSVDLGTDIRRISTSIDEYR